MKFFSLLFLSAIVLGVQGRATMYGPAEKFMGFNEIPSLDRDVKEFELLEHKWRLVFERNGDFLGITIEALDDVSELEADFTITLIKRDKSPLVEQHFHEDFTTMEGDKIIGSTKYLSYDELINPKREFIDEEKGIVFVHVTMELAKMNKLSF